MSIEEKVVLARRVITMERDAATDWEGILVRGERIVRLVRRRDLADLDDGTREIIDLGDRVLMPGFVDVHAHAEVVCRTAYRTVDCRAPECGTVPAVLDTLAGAEPGGRSDWIVGQANLFFDRKLKEGRLPTRAELDTVSRERPIALRAGGHITVLNTRALEVAGIDRTFVPPTYSITGPVTVERDAHGDPTGIVKEMDVLLPLPSPSATELAEAIEDGLGRYFTRYGVTTIGEISETVGGLQAMNELALAGRLPASIRIYLWVPGTMSLEQVPHWRDHLSFTAPESAIRIQGVKMFSDGGFSARSAAVNCCYKDAGDFRGNIAFPKYFLRRALRICQDNGLQLAVHANGDRAQDWLSRSVAELGGAGGGRQRVRIEHAGNLMPNPQTAELWAAAGIVPVPQPVFLYTFGEYFPDYLGEYGLKGRFPFRTLLEAGWRLSGSSDVWIGSEREATNPFFSIWCCLKRQTYSGGFIDVDEAITLEQALRMHTIDAASVMGEEDQKGSLAPGKMADIIALDHDPFEIDVDALRGIGVDFVMARGSVVRSKTAGRF
ncbi:amidohydrolase [Ancylobacter moscoviensis]